MDKTSKDGKGTIERTSFTNQDGKCNSEDESCHSSLTDSATAIEGDLNTQTTSYSTLKGQAASTGSHSVKVSYLMVPIKIFSTNIGATLNQGSPSSSTTRDGSYNVQDLINETVARLASLESTVNEDLGHLHNVLDKRTSLLDDAVNTTAEDLDILERSFNFMLYVLGFSFFLLIFVVLVVVLLTK